MLKCSGTPSVPAGADRGCSIVSSSILRPPGEETGSEANPVLGERIREFFQFTGETPSRAGLLKALVFEYGRAGDTSRVTLDFALQPCVLGGN